MLTERDGTLYARNADPVEIESAILRQPVFATDFTRYMFRARTQGRVIFPYKVTPDGYQIMSEASMRADYPKAYAYLVSRGPVLRNRKQYREWYGYSAPRNLNRHETADILVPLLADRGLFAPAPADGSAYCLMAGGGFSVSISPAIRNCQPCYLLGLLNSRLLFWLLRQMSNKFRGGWITCTKQYFGRLPIRTIDFRAPADVARHDRMVSLVGSMLDLNRRLAAANLDHEKTVLRRQIEATDRQIDELVYELYGLNADEIALVENGS